MDSNFVRIRFEPVSKFPTRNLALMVPAAAEAPPVCTQNCRGNVSLSLSFCLVMVSSVLRRMVVENGIFITTYTCTGRLKSKSFWPVRQVPKTIAKTWPTGYKTTSTQLQIRISAESREICVFLRALFFSFFCLVYFRPSL